MWAFPSSAVRRDSSCLGPESRASDQEREGIIARARSEGEGGGKASHWFADGREAKEVVAVPQRDRREREARRLRP